MRELSLVPRRAKSHPTDESLTSVRPSLFSLMGIRQNHMVSIQERHIPIIPLHRAWPVGLLATSFVSRAGEAYDSTRARPKVRNCRSLLAAPSVAMLAIAFFVGAMAQSFRAQSTADQAPAV